MSDEEQVRSLNEIQRVFEILDNANTDAEKGDTFAYGIQVGKLIALGWVLGEVPSSDLALSYDFETWQLDAKAQEDTLRRELKGLEQLLHFDEQQDAKPDQSSE